MAHKCYGRRCAPLIVLEQMYVSEMSLVSSCLPFLNTGQMLASFQSDDNVPEEKDFVK